MFKFILYLLFLIGEVRCVYQFVDSDFKESYKRELIYGISAATGIGSIVGYFNIPDTPPDVNLTNLGSH